MTFYRYSPLVIMCRSLKLSKQKKEDLTMVGVVAVLFVTIAMLDGVLNGIGF
mgnify:FL=1